jgi:hypothetical protein
MNYVNYLKHTIYTPETYHRRFDLDLPNEDNEPVWKNQAKRIALASLPYVSLYRPAGTLLSAGMGSYRAISHISGALTSESLRDWKGVSVQLLHAALAVFSVASTLFNFTIGLAALTAMDTVQGCITVGQSLIHGEYRKATEEALQTSASAIYLSFMASGALELMVAFTAIQATICFCIQARGDLEQGRYLEAAAKIGMGVIRCRQTKEYIRQIERRRSIFAMQKYVLFIQSALKARQVRHLLENPLFDIQDNIDTRNVHLEDVELGAYFHGYGEALVKGANLAFRTKIIDGKEITELDFKVNHVFREKIQGTIDDFSKLKMKEMQEVLQITQSHATSIRIEKNQVLPLGNGSMDGATKITLEGLGSIWIGSSPDLPTMYDRVVVQMDTKKNLFDFHELMAFLNVDQALHTSSGQDLDRLKMGHLFRTFCPQQATFFERSQEFFDLSLDQLKEKMIEKAPEMEKIFDDYYSKMTPGEIFSGKIRYRINGLAKEAYEQGARGLTAAITGAYSDDALFSRIASMLKMGMLSSETRAQGNMNVTGISTSADFYSGGADSVFTQMVTEQNCRKGQTFSQFLAYQSRARVLISLDALEIGTYQYLNDSYGNRHILPSYWGGSYASRPGILKFIHELQHTKEDPHYPWWWYPANSAHEVMLKERVDPSFFTGVAVQDSHTRDALLSYLRTQNLVASGEQGETILGKPIHQFIKVATHASEELFS